MADNIFTQANTKILSDLQETDKKYNPELKASQSHEINPYDTHTRELFSTYFVNRHDANGHMHTAQWDALSPEQTMQFDNYVTRKEFEGGLKERGYSTDSIALMRQWDEDIKEAMTNGTYDQLIQSGKMLSRDYAEKAINQFTWDESMFDKYVATSRYLAQEIYKKGGDGLFNMTEDILDSLQSYTHDDLKEIYSWMDADQKAQLGFDGIHNEDQFASYAKDRSNQMIAAKKADQDNWFVGFWKSVAHGFVSAVSETIALIPQLIGIVTGVGGWLTFQGFNNAATKALFKAGESVVEGMSGGFDKLIKMDKVDKDSWAYKVGNFTGQAAEIAAELATGAVIAKGLSKATELGVKAAAKQVAKSATKGAVKTGVMSAERKLVRRSARLIENEAVKIARKKGVRKVDEEIINQATKNIVSRTGLDVSKTALGKELTEQIESAAVTATTRLARRGMIKTSQEAISKMESGLVKSFLTEAAKVGTVKLIKTGEKKGIKAAVKEGVKQGAKKFDKRGVRQWLKLGEESKTVFGKAGKYTAVAKGGNPEAAMKLISQMAKKPGAISRSYRTIFGNGDMLSKLFATKAFTNTVIEGKRRGYSTPEALIRGLAAAGTTNVVWGKIHMESRPNGLLGRLAPKSFGAEATLSLGKATTSFLYRNTSAIASTATKMIADGILQEEILEGMWGKDAQGEKGQFTKAFKDNLNLTALAEKFVSALTMHATTAGLGKINNFALVSAGRANITREGQVKKTWEGIEERLKNLKEADKPWEQLWNYYQNQAVEKLTAEGNVEPESHKVNDLAYEFARQEGHFDVVDGINKLYVKDSAYTFGEQVSMRQKQIELTINGDMRNLNQVMYDDMGDHFEETPKQREFFRVVLLNKVLGQDIQGINTEKLKERFKDIDVRSSAEVMVAYKFFIGTHGDKAEVSMEKVDEAFNYVDKLKKEIGDTPWEQIMKWDPGHIMWTTRALSDPKLRGDAKKYNAFKVEMENLAEKYKEEGATKSAEFKDELDTIMQRHNITDKFIANQEAAGNPDAQKTAPIVQEAKESVAEETIEKAKNLNFDDVANKLFKKYLIDNNEGKSKEGAKKALEYIKDLYENGVNGRKLTPMQYGEIVLKFMDMIKTKANKETWYDSEDFSEYEAVANVKNYANRLVAVPFAGRGYPTEKGFKDFVKHNLDVVNTEIEYVNARAADKEYVVPDTTHEQFKDAYDEIKDLNNILSSKDGQKALDILFKNNNVNSEDIKKAYNEAEKLAKTKADALTRESLNIHEYNKGKATEDRKPYKSAEALAKEEAEARKEKADNEAKETVPVFDFAKIDETEGFLGIDDIDFC